MLTQFLLLECLFFIPPHLLKLHLLCSLHLQEHLLLFLVGDLPLEFVVLGILDVLVPENVVEQPLFLNLDLLLNCQIPHALCLCLVHRRAVHAHLLRFVRRLHVLRLKGLDIAHPVLRRADARVDVGHGVRHAHFAPVDVSVLANLPATFDRQHLHQV